jgi:hypothetical protein
MSRLASVILIAMLASTASRAGGAITYDLIPVVSDGFSITGSVTTDGTIGSLTPPDDPPSPTTVTSPYILSWDWTATNAVTTYSGSSSIAGAAAAELGLMASATELYLPYPENAFVSSVFEMAPPASTDPASAAVILHFDATWFPGLPNPFYSRTWFQNADLPTTYVDVSTTRPTDSYVFAVAVPTPEPSAVVLLSLGSFALGIAARRKMRARVKS